MRPEVYDVMFAFATTTCSKKTNDYVIMLKNHERALHVNAVGKVTATDISLAQFFTMESVGDILDDTFKIALYVKEVGRYLCFRKGKLVGMKHISTDCHFIESLDHGYFLYANAYNPLWRVGFTRSFKPVGPRHLQRPQAMRKACFLFVKINAEHFDRDMFTTTAAPSTTTTTTTLLPYSSKSNHNRGHRNQETMMKSSITADLEEEDASQEQQRNKRKRPHHHNQEVEESPYHGVEKRRKADHNNTRKRKHHQRLAAAGNTAASPQPKNLVRQQSSGHKGLENRRRKFQREEHARKMRLQNQRRRKQIESHQNLPPPPPPFASSSSSSSASASVSATSLAATASLAPSALNIVAMLAAGRRKKARRKKKSESGATQTQTANGHDDHEAAMDLQLVAQHPPNPAAGSLYDLAPEEAVERSSSSSNGDKVAQHHHEHNYYQQPRQFQPVTSSMPATPENNVQPQNHKYSNSPKDRRNLSNSHKHSTSSSPKPSHSRSHSQHSSRNYKHSHSDSPSDSHSNLNENTNVNVNNNNNNNNDNDNAIPALPKNFNVSKDSNHSKQYFTNTMTDFNTRKLMLPNHSQTSTPPPPPHHQPLHITPNEPPSPTPSHHYNNQHQSQSAIAIVSDSDSDSVMLRRSRRDLSLIHSLTSQHQRQRNYRNSSTTLPRPKVVNSRETSNENIKQTEHRGDNDNSSIEVVNVATHRNNEEGNVAAVGNSNRLLCYSNHIRNDNNFQHQQQQQQQKQQQHLVNRLKLIYLNRISNDNSRSNYNTNSNKYILNNSNNNKQASIQSISSSSSKTSNRINDNKPTIEMATHRLRSQLLISLNLKENLQNVMVEEETLNQVEEDTTTIVNNIISYNNQNPKVISNDLRDNNNIFLKLDDIEKEADKEEIKSLYAALKKLFFLGQHVNRQQQQPQQEQQLQVIDNNKLININNDDVNNVQYTNYDHNDVKHYDDGVDDDENDNDDELIRNENKYEKIIVQYRSVVYLFKKKKIRKKENNPLKLIKEW